MKVLNKPVAFVAFIVIFFSTILCPFVRVPLVGNWNMYQLDTGLFFLTNALLAVCVLLFVSRKVRAYRIGTFVFAGWCVLGFLAVYFKIHHFFGFKMMDNLLAKTLHLKWGWLVFFAGAVLLLFSVRTVRKIEN